MEFELFGLPGSGKSHYCNNMSNKYIEIKLNNIFEKIYYFSRFVFKSPILSLYLLKELILNIKCFDNQNYLRIFIHKFLGSYMCSFAKYEKSRSIKTDKIKIIDEGLLQLIYSIYDQPKKTKIKKTFNFVKHKLVDIKNVEINEKERSNRLKKRNDYPRKQFGKKYYLIWNKNSINSYNIIKEYI